MSTYAYGPENGPHLSAERPKSGLLALTRLLYDLVTGFTSVHLLQSPLLVCRPFPIRGQPAVLFVQPPLEAAGRLYRLSSISGCPQLVAVFNE